MTILKKAAAVLTVFLITLFGVCVHVGATAFDNAYELTSGKTLKTTLNADEAKYYKIVLTEKGEMKIKSIMDASSISCSQWIYIYNSDGEELNNFFAGSNSAGISTASQNINLSKGTYYIKVRRWPGTSGSGTTKITATFPSDEKASAKSKTSASYPVIYMDNGDTVKLGAYVAGKVSSDITLSSSKTDVAKIDSDGIVTAKAKGTSTVSITSGKTTVKVIVVVS